MAPPAAKPIGLSISSWLMLVHGLGSLLLLSKLLAEWIRLQRLRASGSRLSTRQARLFEEIGRRFRFVRQPQLLVSNSVSAPISFGCLRPTVVMPESVIAQDDFAKIAIAHELAHLSRYDSWFNWIQNLLLAIWWYNPMLWVLNGQIRKVREDCCDDIVLVSGLVTDCQYSDSLVEIAKLSSKDDYSDRLQTAFSMAQHPLEKRLLRIMNSGLPRARRLSWLGVLAVVVLCALCLPGLRIVFAEGGFSQPTNNLESEYQVEPAMKNASAEIITPDPDETMVLTFPEDFEIGSLEVMDLPEPSTNLPGYLSFTWDGKVVGPAVGKVTVRRESRLGIKINGEKQLEKLDHLVGKPIAVLELTKPTISTDLLTRLEKLDSLQEIHLWKCTIDPEIDVSKLNGLPKLKEIHWYQDGGDLVARQQLAVWAAKSKQLQNLYGGNGAWLEVDAIKAFAQHPNPLFLQVEFDDNANEKIQALAKIPKLVGLDLAVKENVEPDFHQYLRQLQQLNIANWNEGDLTSSLMDGLIEMPALKRLRFQGKVKPTNEFIQRLPELKSLQQIGFNRSLPREQKKLLSEAMMRMPSLRSLPTITKPSGELLMELAKRSDITSLDIEGLGNQATVEQLVELIEANRELEILGLNEIVFSEKLVATICDLKVLNHLDLTVQDFEPELFTPLKKLASLESMFLQVNGAVGDLSVLASLPNLKSIQVWVESFDSGLWQFVGDCPKLELFDILTGVSDDQLAQWVAKNPSLRKVGLGQDMVMTDAGVKKFAQCDHLESLSLGGDISKDAVMSLRRLPNLASLSVWSDELSSGDRQELKEAFKDLRHLDLRDHYPSIGKRTRGDDGFLRSTPDEGRAKLDALEGQGFQELLKDSLSPEIQKQLKGRVVMVQFWGTWCGARLNPGYQRLHDLYHKKGFEVLGIHTKARKETCEDYLKKHPNPWPNIIDDDGSLVDRFAVGGFPTMFIFDRDGKLQVASAHRFGLADAIETLLERD